MINELNQLEEVLKKVQLNIMNFKYICGVLVLFKMLSIALFDTNDSSNYILDNIVLTVFKMTPLIFNITYQYYIANSLLNIMQSGEKEILTHLKSKGIKKVIMTWSMSDLMLLGFVMLRPFIIQTCIRLGLSENKMVFID